MFLLSFVTINIMNSYLDLSKSSSCDIKTLWHADLKVYKINTVKSRPMFYL